MFLVSTGLHLLPPADRQPPHAAQLVAWRTPEEWRGDATSWPQGAAGLTGLTKSRRTAVAGVCIVWPILHKP